MNLEIAKHEKLSLKGHPLFTEAWLEQCIKEKPDLLGLGDVEVLDIQRMQECGGRLDLLLYDPKKEIRYELELMLGPTDPSHIIRCIEYWDVERRRYPFYEHVAVLVAEDVTTRFLNVLSLMSGTIPIIAIKLNALKVGEQVILDFVHVLRQTSLRADDESDTVSPVVDRAYWEQKVGPQILRICDRVLVIINERAKQQQSLVYRKAHIGLTSGASRRNFVFFYPRKGFLHLGAYISDPDPWANRLEEAGLPVEERSSGKLRVVLRPSDFDAHESLLRELIHQATNEYET